MLLFIFDNGVNKKKGFIDSSIAKKGKNLNLHVLDYLLEETSQGTAFPLDGCVHVDAAVAPKKLGLHGSGGRQV